MVRYKNPPYQSYPIPGKQFGKIANASLSIECTHFSDQKSGFLRGMISNDTDDLDQEI
jgi:hypothetical protein